MWCSSCEIYLPYLGETAKCATCGTPLTLTSDEVLGDSPVCIVDEVRVPQVQMARQVEDALRAGECLVAEAGTGTGKSFAVLVPAILTKKRVVVSTATTLLQHQYVSSTLPFLAAKMGDLGYRVIFAVAKGKGHYLCRRQLARDLKSLNKEFGSYKEWATFINWAEETESGDKQELGNSVPPFWSRVSAEECVSISSCKVSRNGECGYAMARHRMLNANIVVANHAVVGLHMALPPSAKLLPEHSVCVIDEAHHAEDYFRNAFSTELGQMSIPYLSTYLKKGEVYPTSALASEARKNMVKTSKELFSKTIPSLFVQGRRQAVISGTDLDPVAEDLLGDVRAVHRFVREVLDEDVAISTNVKMPVIDYQQAQEDRDNGVTEEYRIDQLRKAAAERVLTAKVVLGRVARVLENVQTLRADAAGTVLYAEDTNRSRARYLVRRSPVFIGPRLREALYPKLESTVFTSATLALNDGDFSHFREALGLPKNTTREFRAMSPFDYRRRSVLYLPKHLPVHPNNDPTCLDKEAALDEYFQALTKEIVRLVKISGGGALILSSARKEMEALYERTKAIIRYPTRIQEASVSTGALEEWFRNEENPVLFATKSFWEGISIEGAQLRMVIIPKIPFPVPTDPIFKAKEKALKRTGSSSFEVFNKLSVPEMIKDVQQGLGRLIRTMDDFGVAAILDNRTARGSQNFKRGYANTLLNSLPFSTQVDDIKLVRLAMGKFVW